MNLYRLGVWLAIFTATAWGTVPLPPDGELLKVLRARLPSHGDAAERKVTRVGNRTIEFESWVSTEADFGDAKEILADWDHYGDWVLANINKKPSGGNYLVQILDLKPAAGQKDTVVTTVKIDLPLFQHELQCVLKLKSMGTPEAFTLIGDISGMTGTYIENVEAVLKMFPVEKTTNRAWIYVKGLVKLKNWLLYEAMPERMLKSETGQRIQTIVDNYLKEESRRRLARAPSTKKR